MFTNYPKYTIVRVSSETVMSDHTVHADIKSCMLAFVCWKEKFWIIKIVTIQRDRKFCAEVFTVLKMPR